MADRRHPGRGQRSRHRTLVYVAGITLVTAALLSVTLLRNNKDDPQRAASDRYRQELITPEEAHSVIKAPDRQAEPAPVTTESTPVAHHSAEPVEPVEIPKLAWREEIVRPGDSFTTIMQRMGYSPAVVAKIMASGAPAEPLKRLKPQHRLKVLEQQEQLQQVHYEIDRTSVLEVDLTKEAVVAKTVALDIEIRNSEAAGTIDSSLYLAGQASGLSDALIMELANIFGWDVDYTLDLREGDRFYVIYSDLLHQGKKVSDGEILAARLAVNGRTLTALKYQDKNGRADYYAPNGQSMRKAFTRNPLPITRITSRFNPNRLHPIFKTRRPHRGVDYGAASGTPVRATGDGRVIFKGKKGGYGNTVIIQHGQKYTTLYAHLKNFRKGLHTGQSIKQGKTIAYVGQSGWATGPHLHYEFRVNGVHHNPLTVKLPAAEPILKAEKASFLTSISPLLSQLDQLETTQLAAAGTTQ